MAKQQLSLKQLAINNDNTSIIITIGLATFIFIFSCVASNALLKQRAYHATVIGKKKAALAQLKKNTEEVEKLKKSYIAFADSQENVLGGSATGNGDKDGENPRLVLDALPSKYDFPALATSLEKVFSQYKIENLQGTDDEIAQSAAEASASPQPLEIPFAVSTGGSEAAAKDVLLLYERSIRPIQISKLKLESAGDSLKISVEAKTYFQPQKKFDVKPEAVK